MSQFHEGNRIQLLNSGSEYFPALEAACDAATTEIHIQTYIFSDDDTGRRIAQALIKAAQRKVAVHVLVDGFGSKELSEEFIGSLRTAGVHILKYRPQISPWTLKRERLRRLHHKIVVIDGRVAFVGGINIIDDMDTPDHVPPRFDYTVQITGPLLADIHAIVVQLWRLTLWTQWRVRRLPVNVSVTAASAGTQRAAFVIRNNVRHRRDIESAYLGAIRAAQREIIIANAYFFPGSRFRRALIDAAARGVRVVLLLQGRVEYFLLHFAARSLYRQLLDAGIEIHEFHRGFLHAKVAVVDTRWATVGSSNIDPMSLLLAREANIVVDDTGFAAQLRGSLLQAVASGAQQVEREAWLRDQSWPARVMMRLCYVLVRLLTGVSTYGRSRNYTE